MRVYFIISSTIFFLGMLWFFYERSDRFFSFNPPKNLEMYPRPLFHPDTVFKFNWKLKDKSFSFARTDRLAPWAPTVPPHRIQEKLNILAGLKGEQISPLKNPVVLIEIFFKDGQEWTAESDGTLFRWIKGPHTGLGGRPKSPYNRIFLQGDQAFKQERLHWCEGRPTKLKAYTKEAGDLELEELNNRWVRQKAPSGTKSGELNSPETTLIEQWIGRACLIDIKEFYSPELLDLSSRDELAELSVSFKDKAQADFKVYKNGYVEMTKGERKQLFLSESFSENVLSLMSIGKK